MLPSLLRFVALTFLGGLVVMVLASGCGRSSLEPESLDSGARRAACGPSTCPNGCCDEAGTCRTGRDVLACGSVGARCSDCVAGGFDVCTSARVCGRDDPSCSSGTCLGCCAVVDGRMRCLSGTEPMYCGRDGEECSGCAVEGRVCDAEARTCGPTRCDPTSCDGCCVGDACLPGDSALACGTRGAQCSSCASGQACRPEVGGGGRCEGLAICGPETCSGCCDADGQCVSGHDSGACGRRGQACEACGADEVCAANAANGRTCQPRPTCGPSTCPGCCVGDICAVGTQPNACGSGGELCQSCSSQVPARVCQSGSCQLPSCGPATCPNGCCSGDACVVGTQDHACGPIGGAACGDCAASNQVCQGRQCVERCGPSTCAGCCRPNNTCDALGSHDTSCGQGGVACASCAATGSFCNGLVVPRRCSSEQSTCPAPYAECPNGTTTPIAVQLQGRCSDASLDTLTTACKDGPGSPTCVATFSALPADCRTCLSPLNHPFEERSGLYACAAPAVSEGCRRSMGCAADCAATSCGQCLSTSEGTCRALVNQSGRPCAGFTSDVNGCASAVLSTGLCSPLSYPNYGAWLRTVGDQFCGDGS